MTVMTLNIAHGRALAASQAGLTREQIQRNLDDVAACLADTAPDVVALQEVDGVSTWSGRFDHLSHLAQAANLPYQKFGAHVDVDLLGESLLYGTALLANRPLTRGDTLAFATHPLDFKGMTSARIQFDDRLILVVSVHLDTTSRDIRVRQAKLLIDRLSGHRLPLVLMGDFNCDWSEGDALELIAKRLNLRGWQPGTPVMATYPSSHPEQRVDWILLSKELRFEDYRVVPVLVSDHLGVVAEIAWDPEPADTRVGFTFSVYVSH
jgi:endonuclease/exonuclease/phosphatase family metal-dependent hydrolase